MAACSPGDWPRACAVPVETHHHHDPPQRLKRGFVLFSPPRPGPRARGSEGEGTAATDQAWAGGTS